MSDPALYTLDELAELVEAALAGHDYPGAPTGRVRAVPDQRAIRWYTTRGLVDRPAASRGRLALYGRRHLLQLVAIKRRQAQGQPLAQIQAELAGATDDLLAVIAELPAASQPPAAVPARPAAVAAPATLPVARRFWTARTAAPGRDNSGHSSPEHSSTGHNSHDGPARPVSGAAVDLHGIHLAPGVTLLVPNRAGATADPAAVREAARPLLDLLAASGLISATDPTATDPSEEDSR